MADPARRLVPVFMAFGILHDEKVHFFGLNNVLGQMDCSPWRISKRMLVFLSTGTD